jgi:hypothetical protein
MPSPSLQSAMAVIVALSGCALAPDKCDPGWGWKALRLEPANARELYALLWRSEERAPRPSDYWFASKGGQLKLCRAAGDGGCGSTSHTFLLAAGKWELGKEIEEVICHGS